MKPLLRLISVSALILATALPVPAQAGFCLDTLLGKLFSNRKMSEADQVAQIIEQLKNPPASTDQAHVQFALSPLGESGQVTITRLSGMPWRSTHTPVPGATLLGDPRRFFGMLNEYSASEAQAVTKYFGFEPIDDAHVLAPGTLLLQVRLSALHLELSPRFYVTSGHESVPEFLKNFANERGVPIDADTLLRIHDLSYHTGAIFIPALALEHARKQVETYLAFLEFIEPKIPQSPSPPGLRHKLKLISEQVAFAIDSGTGNFMLRFASGAISGASRAVYVDLVHGGRSPKQLLEMLISPPVGTTLPRLDNRQRNWLLSQLDEFSATRSDAAFTERLYKEYNPTINSAQIRSRIQEVVDAVAAQAKPSP